LNHEIEKNHSEQFIKTLNEHLESDDTVGAIQKFNIQELIKNISHRFDR
jgi:hypothetical protein